MKINDPNQLVKQLLKEGRTYRELAIAADVTEMTIRNWEKKAPKLFNQQAFISMQKLLKNKGK